MLVKILPADNGAVAGYFNNDLLQFTVESEITIIENNIDYVPRDEIPIIEKKDGKVVSGDNGPVTSPPLSSSPHRVLVALQILTASLKNIHLLTTDKSGWFM